MVAMLVLALHLSHGFFSVFQTLGINSPRLQCCLKKLAYGFAALIFFGNISMPLAVMFGVIKLAAEG
jgi:succinate dehydrogenase / fumarate reductase cytochrome b subunit